MKIKYKYIHFVEEIEGCEWYCFNNKSGSELGRIIHYHRWRQYVIEFEPGCVFNDTCLTDIAHFLKQLQSGKSKAKATKQGD